MIKRTKTRKIYIGSVAIGGGAPISVQSMTNTDTRDVQATLEQIKRVADAGCDIIRCAVPDEKAAKCLCEICEASPLPVIADIHFRGELALLSLDADIKGLRINPGNLENPEDIARIAEKAGDKNVPIRVGVNAGSLSKKWREEIHQGTCTVEEAMVESALVHVRLLEKQGFELIKIALKSSHVPTTIQAYRLMANRCDYPFHVGITEAGTPRIGIVKSCVGIGALLSEGLGDTLRVSLTADPEQEVFVGINILQSLGLREQGTEIISCPMCGRMEINLLPLVEKVEQHLAKETIPIKVAVMGCIVNGPGEAREADVGIAGGKGSGALFRGGEIVRSVPEEELFTALAAEIDKIIEEKKK